MSGLRACLRLDVRLQARSKLYLIGAAVAVMLGLVGRFLVGAAHGAKAVPVLYLLGIGGTTYVFGAAMVLLEKSDGTLQALRASPLTSKAYLGSKLITLTSFALVEGLIVQLVGFYEVGFNPLPLFCGVACLGALNTLIGLGQVAPHDSIFSFLFPGALLIGVGLQLPAFYVLQVGPDGLWYLFPSQGPLLLMLAAFQPLSQAQWLYAIASSLAGLGLAALWAHVRFARHIALQER